MTETNGGISFTGLLTIVFIVLKLCNVINWSWWWVLSPLWISFGLGLTVGVVFLIIDVVFLIMCLLEKHQDKKKGYGV